MVEDGEMKKKAYMQWRQSAMMRTKGWEDLRDTLASDLSHTNEIATGMINQHAIDCYAMNMNYGTYEVEHGARINTSFSLYDHATVENLMRDDPKIIPKARMDIPKDLQWNRQKLTSAITQGILTGESIPDIAKRLSGVADMNAHAALRNARTYTTAAENKGRVDSYERAQSMGIEMEQEWMSTPDGRTRDSHVDLDGERIPVGGTFSNGCRYPGDPGGAPEEVYNCRCTLVAALKDYKYDPTRFTRLPEGMSYDDWKEAARERLDEKREQNPENKATYTVKGLTRPVRPRKSDFGGDLDAFEAARAAYRQQRDDFERSIDEAVERALGVTRFATKDDVLKWATDNGIIIDKSVLDAIDIRAFNEASMVLDEMFKRFPDTAFYDWEGYDGTIHKFNFGIGLTEDGLLSANGGFNFNPRYFTDYEIGLREAFDGLTDGTLVKGDGSFGTLVRHEFGHNVQSRIYTKIDDKYHVSADDWRLHFSKFDDYIAARNAAQEERAQFDKELLALAGKNGSSEYSNTNTLELFAEGFAEHTSGGDTEFGREFGEFLSRWY